MEKENKYKDLSKEEIEKALGDMLYGKESVKKAEDRFPSITHYTWTAEDGQKCSAWKIDIGSSVITVGDGGIELFKKAFKEQGMKFLDVMEADDDL